MQQLWTVIFVMLLGVGWALAACHDREKERRQHRRVAADRKEKDA